MVQRDLWLPELFTLIKMDYGLGSRAIAFKHRDTPPPALKPEYSALHCPTKELLDIWWQKRLNRDLQRVALIIGSGLSPSEVYRECTDVLYNTVRVEVIPSLQRMRKTQRTLQHCHHNITPHIVIPNALVYTCLAHHSRKVMNCDIGLHALAVQPIPT